MQIEPLRPEGVDELVRITLRAWEPVFPALEESMLPAVYKTFYPNGWRHLQEATVKAMCTDDSVRVSVAILDDACVGFVAAKVHQEDSMGEIYMIASDPDCQRQGVATALTNHALEWFKEQGLQIAMVETGADPGHEPARRTYEAAGFTLLPVARYFKEL